MSTLKKAIKLLTSEERRRGLMVLVLVMGMALLETVGVASVMPFLAVLGNPSMLETNTVLSTMYGWGQSVSLDTPYRFLLALGVASFLLILISAAFRTLTHYVMNHYVRMREHTLALRLLEIYLRQPYAFFLDRHSGEMSTGVLSQVGQVVGSVFAPVFNMIASALVVITITGLLIVINPWLALLAAGMLGGLYVLVFGVLRKRLSSMGAVLVESNKARFMATSEALGGIKDIKLLGREAAYLDRFESPSKRFAANQALYQTLNQVPNYLIEAIIFGAMLLLTMVLLVLSGGLSSGALGQILPILGLYAFAAYRLKPAIQTVYQGFASLRYGQAAVDAVYEDMFPTEVPMLLPSETPEKLPIRQGIRLEQLSFAYPKAPKPALVDLELEIPVGSSIGLVGSTGAGKTTLVDIILGLLRPTQGAISVDGKPITDESLRSWQQSLGYVPQEIFLTDTTIAENIALGIPKDKINLEQVHRCAKMAQVHEFVSQELPRGYETLVGERGVRLSGGQRQRIGIARALYHNPEVLVFDEATSALDTVTERAVMEAIDALAHQKTIILIAHRLSTVKNCDQIVLLEHGAMKAKGRYEDLIHGNDQFRAMAGAR